MAPARQWHRTCSVQSTTGVMNVALLEKAACKAGKAGKSPPSCLPHCATQCCLAGVTSCADTHHTDLSKILNRCISLRQGTIHMWPKEPPQLLQVALPSAAAPERSSIATQDEIKLKTVETLPAALTAGMHTSSQPYNSPAGKLYTITCYELSCCCCSATMGSAIQRCTQHMTTSV
jgi:hypothetical protein